MKKIITFLAVAAMFSLQSCTVNDTTDYVDYDTISEVFEIKNVNFSYNSIDGFNIYQKLTPKILASDVVLIYRLSGTIDPSTPVWQLIPRTLYLTNGREIDYDFDFSREDFKIFVRGNYNLETTPNYLDNQTFRIVIVPGNFAKTIDKNNFDAVITALNVNENQIQKINF